MRIAPVLEMAHFASRSFSLPPTDRDDLRQELGVLGLVLSRRGRRLPYIKGAMRNRSVDFLRERARRFRRLLPIEEANHLTLAAKEIPSEILELERLAARMPEASSRMLTLLREGHTVVEAAAALDIPRRSATRIVARIREAVKGGVSCA